MKRLNTRIAKPEQIEDARLILFFVLLLLVETGFVMYLERLPVLPATRTTTTFMVLPPWYGRPRAEVSLLLSVVGGLLTWSGHALLQFLRHKNNSELRPGHKHQLIERLKTTALYATVACVDLLSIHFSR